VPGKDTIFLSAPAASGAKDPACICPAVRRIFMVIYGRKGFAIYLKPPRWNHTLSAARILCWI